MTITVEIVTPQKVLKLAQSLSPDDLRWLIAKLSQFLDDELLLENITLDKAINLFLTDRCSLGRAAELAGVTRWDIIDILKERSIPIMVYSSKSVEEMDELAEELEHEGLLC